MAEYHVGCGLFAIYAGLLNKDKTMWRDGKTECTDEALCAVRDYLLLQIEDKKSSFGYEWRRKDGKIIQLSVIVKDGEEND